MRVCTKTRFQAGPGILPIQITLTWFDSKGTYRRQITFFFSSWDKVSKLNAHVFFLNHKAIFLSTCKDTRVF